MSGFAKGVLAAVVVIAAGLFAIYHFVVGGEPGAGGLHVQRSHLAQGFSTVTVYKARVAAYYNERGVLPLSNRAAGLPPPDQIGGEILNRLEIDRGVITASFSGLTGVDGGSVKFEPDVSKPNKGVTWSCVTGSYSDIQSWAPQCRYE